MAVYFVYRTHDGAPSEKHVRRFEYDTILDWAKANLKQFDNDDKASKYAETLLGVPRLSEVFLLNEDHPARGTPRKLADVKEWFRALYLEEDGEAHGPHHLQFYCGGDGETAIYLFDDHYRAKKPGKADFLLLDGWGLPAGDSDASQPKLPKTDRDSRKWDGDGSLYVVSLFADSKYNLDDLQPADRIDGLRVPDLARFLLVAFPPEREAFGLRELRKNLQALLKAPTGEDAGFLLAIRDQPAEQIHWGAYSDWLQDRNLAPAGLHLLELALRAKECSIGYESRNPKLDFVKVSPHVAQACKHRSRHPNSPSLAVGWQDYYGQFIFFDDRWAAAHPTLAAGILTFASRWDVLT